MPAGRRPRPTKLRLLEGNPGKRKLNDREPQPVTRLEMPVIVEANHKAALEWTRVVASMPPGFYTDADASQLTVHCISWSMYTQALAVVEAEGITTAGSKGQLVVHPALAIVSKQASNLMQCADRLGLHPSARARMNVPPPPPTPPDPRDDLLRG